MPIATNMAPCWYSRFDKSPGRKGIKMKLFGGWLKRVEKKLDYLVV